MNHSTIVSFYSCTWSATPIYTSHRAHSPKSIHCGSYRLCLSVRLFHLQWNEHQCSPSVIEEITSDRENLFHNRRISQISCEPPSSRVHWIHPHPYFINLAFYFSFSRSFQSKVLDTLPKAISIKSVHCYYCRFWQ